MYTSIEEFNYDEDLEHYGVKGQRWGIRKYQNKDGSLTELGRKHYGGEKAREYKRAETEVQIKKLEKAVSKGDLKKANEAMKNLNALNRMEEKDITNEMLGLVQSGSKAGAFGLVGVLAAATVVVPKTRKERAERFVSDYEDLTMDYIRDKLNELKRSSS